ncbi:hypothetical protein KCMC57_up19740 [Kitasatospora sp. CMC57]|uniref:Uncharacterized protein n=1 Tax=Kitasatospora sp. CMC57 TaxID=3231513 RepID=A0AB33JS14_9ACTN
MTVARTASTGTTLVQYPVRTRSGSRPDRVVSGRETALGTLTTYRAGPWTHVRVRPFDVTIGQKSDGPPTPRATELPCDR